MKSDLKKYGSWALITGASSGIGKEFAYRLAAQNINLILAARRIEKLNAIGQELSSSYGIDVVTAGIDLSSSSFMEELIDTVGDRIPGIIINNAGTAQPGSFELAQISKYNKMMQVNCIAPLLITHHFIKDMIRRKTGAIIFVGSVSGLIPSPYNSVYSASKAFNVFLGDALWYEMKNKNIDTLVVNPGSTNTEFNRVDKIGKNMNLRSAEQVVNTALNALGSKINVIDGFINKIVFSILKIMPARMTLISSGRWIRKRIHG